MRERIGIVGEHDLPIARDAQAFGTDGRGDHGLAHGEGLEDLQSRAATGTQRHDIERRFVDVRANVWYCAGHGHTQPHE